MIKVDLITGFLGSGKTTFIKKYAKYFLDKGQKIGILENDHGAVNVDMLMLNELRGENLELEMVAGGCDDECHRRRFKTKLIAMGMSGYDRVIIEPSGIFDVDEFFDALHDEPLDRWYEAGNVIAIVDGSLEQDISRAADFYLGSQVSCAGAILISKVQNHTPEEIQKVKDHVCEAVKTIGCTRNVSASFVTVDWENMPDSIMDEIANCGYHNASYIKYNFRNKFETLYFLESKVKSDKKVEAARKLLESDEYGNVLRVKGFYPDDSKTIGNTVYKQLNATKREITITDIPVGQDVFIVIGENLQEEKINELFEVD